jgi:hypothetical protein
MFSGHAGQQPSLPKYSVAISQVPVVRSCKLELNATHPISLPTAHRHHIRGRIFLSESKEIVRQNGFRGLETVEATIKYNYTV